jgi:hypothetical protein
MDMIHDLQNVLRAKTSKGGVVLSISNDWPVITLTSLTLVFAKKIVPLNTNVHIVKGISLTSAEILLYSWFWLINGKDSFAPCHSTGMHYTSLLFTYLQHIPRKYLMEKTVFSYSYCYLKI